MSPNRTLRVLIVDDSTVARIVLRGFLEKTGDIHVVGEAANGEEAILLARQLRPDVVTMDLNMPVMDGISAIDAIMHEKAVPILVVTSASEADHALRALDAGALEVMAKSECTPDKAEVFVRKVRMLAGVSVFTRFRRKTRDLTSPETCPSPPLINNGQGARPPQLRRAFAIACSTGGPQALGQILPQLPEHFPAPIVIAQHMSDGFVEGMARWLDKLSLLKVKVGEQGEPLTPGVVYLAPSETNMIVSADGTIAMRPRTSADIYRPSCDQLLASVAEVFGAGAVGIILTGMGRDGVQGMGRIHQLGGWCLAQDEESSVIYGMNHEAVKAGHIHRQLPLNHIADQMRHLISDNGNNPRTPEEVPHAR